MIAHPDQHFDRETLRQLLDETLPRDKVDPVQEHLSHCESCRHQLEHLAGQQHWWDETVDILTESAVTRKDHAATSIPLRTIDASLEWIRPLLETVPEDDASVGRLDQYQVQGVIGQGGMGVVLRGIDPELNRPVAIKILSPHLAGVGAARARFMREAQAAAAIVHPSVVPIYSVVTSSRLPYIVMPCINGGNLQQRIDREGPLELSEILRIGLQVAEGLAAAHRHGVIHRDIKPANILVEEGNGRVLISDFGLARALDDATLTNSGMLAGTPQYMSPEQARGDSIDARSDLFSLGSLLYALSTGRPPFRAESPLAVLRKITETNPRPIHEINELLPPWLDQLVGRLMSTELATRVGSAEEVVELLRDSLAHVRNPSANPLPRTLTRPRWASNGVLATAAILVTLLLVGFALSDFINHRGTANSIRATAPVDPASSDGSDNSSAKVGPLDPAQLEWSDQQGQFELHSIQQTIDHLLLEMDYDTGLDK